MSPKFVTFMTLSNTFEIKDIKIRIVDRFLFVEAERSFGEKGNNLSKWKYKHCIHLRKSVDIDKLKAFYDG